MDHPADIDHDHPAGHGFIRTVSGLWVHLLEPDLTGLPLQDVATALSHVNRFGGHTPAPYSVAEHSIHVATQLWRMFGDDELAAAGLFHDATEAFLGDMVRPLKNALPEYRVLEARMEEAVADRFRLNLLHDPRVKEVDLAILGWEMPMVRDADWRTPTPPATVAQAFLKAARRYGVR